MKDFITGVGENWTNTRGMLPTEAAAAVADADAKLRTLYADFHRGPQSIWPGFEEYAILYSDYYSRRNFPFRSSLPDDHALDRYMFRWHPGAVIDESDAGMVYAISRFGAVQLTPQLLNALEEMPGNTLRASMDSAIGQAATGEREVIQNSLRAALDKLMSEGIIQLVPARGESAHQQEDRPSSQGATETSAVPAGAAASFHSSPRRSL
jgi:hypothetical protein